MSFVLGGIIFLCLAWVIYTVFTDAEQLTSPSVVKIFIPLAIAFILGITMFFLKNGTLILAIIVIVFAFLGMIVCARKQNVYAYAQPLAIALLFVVLTCMVIILTKTMGDNDIGEIIAHELHYSASGAYVMGQHIAKKFKGKKALIIVTENWKKNNRMVKIVEALKKGMNGKVEVKAIDYPVIPKRKKLKGEDGLEEDFAVMNDMISAEYYNNLIDRYKDCNLLIFMSGLPQDSVNLNIWEMDDDTRPMVVAMFADASSFKRAIEANYIMILAYKPDVKFTEEAPPSDYKKAFDQRYIILDKDNVAKVAKKYKKYFQNMK